MDQFEIKLAAPLASEQQLQYLRSKIPENA
jgi:hypothetical protein